MENLYDYAYQWRIDAEARLDEIYAMALEGTESDDNDSDNKDSDDDGESKTPVASKSLNGELRASNKFDKILKTIKETVSALIKKVINNIQERKKKKQSAKWEEGQKKFLADLEAKKANPGFQTPKQPVTLYKYNMNKLRESINAFDKISSSLISCWNGLMEKLDDTEDTDMSEDDYKKLIETYFSDNGMTGITTYVVTDKDRKDLADMNETMRNGLRGEKVTIKPTANDAAWAENIVKQTPAFLKALDAQQGNLNRLQSEMDKNLKLEISHNGNKNISGVLNIASKQYLESVSGLIPYISTFYDLVDEAYVQSTTLLDLVYTKEDNNEEENDNE